MSSYSKAVFTLRYWMSVQCHVIVMTLYIIENIKSAGGAKYAIFLPRLTLLTGRLIGRLFHAGKGAYFLMALTFLFVMGFLVGIVRYNNMTSSGPAVPLIASCNWELLSTPAVTSDSLLCLEVVLRAERSC